MSADRLTEIQSRLDAAVPGPWTADVKIGPWWFIRGPERIECAHAMEYAGHDNRPLIEHARADIEWLIARVRELEANA